MLRRYEEAAAAYDQSIALNPAIDYAGGYLLYAKLNICDWNGYAEACAALKAALAAATRVAQPFEAIALPLSAAEQWQCAKHFVDERFPLKTPLAAGTKYSHDRIRVAYLSADLHEHATAYLMAGVFEQHDRKQFEVTALSYGSASDSEIRR